MIFACTHVEKPSFRAFSTIARIGCPASRCASNAASKRDCARFASNGTRSPLALTIRAQYSAQKPVSSKSRSRSSSVTRI
jgi:hypothetical protein